MPLARIDLAEGKSADFRHTIGEVVHDDLVEVLKAPEDDRFQVITEHPQSRRLEESKHEAGSNDSGDVSRRRLH
jgi:hypothetical protein